MARLDLPYAYLRDEKEAAAKEGRAAKKLTIPAYIKTAFDFVKE